MSEERKTMVSPTGRLAFIKNLFVSGGDKDRFSGALIFDKSQDLKALKAGMLECAKLKFKEEDIKSKKFSWGVKAVDADDNKVDFLDGNMLVMNMDRNGTFGPPEVYGSNRGPDGKLEKLIDGDLKAGDHARAVISFFAWEYQGKKGVKVNFDGIQFIKADEAFYTAPTSDSYFEETAFDVAVEVSETNENATGGDEASDFEF